MHGPTNVKSGNVIHPSGYIKCISFTYVISIIYQSEYIVFIFHLFILLQRIYVIVFGTLLL